MIFRKSKKTVKKSMWWMDKLITWIIISGAAASIFGLSRTKKGRSFWKRTLLVSENIGKKSINMFGKITVNILEKFSNK